MALLAGRLLLLLLLAFDWATDPSHGTSPLSRPLASTETYCYSVSSPGAALKLCTLESMAGSAGLLARGLALPTLDHPSPRPMVPPPPIHNLIYVFLSIRR